MEFTGAITDISSNIITGEVDITFSVNEKTHILPEYDRLKNIKKLKITAVQFREKRSKDANAYMWSLLQKMAEVLRTSKDELYLDILGKYGVFTHIIVKSNVVDRVKAEWRTVRDLGEVKVNGITGIQLQCYFGSSTYDTKEMSKLIDGLVSECKELEIETLPPEELNRMKQEWGV
jgi:hypothetical protein